MLSKAKIVAVAAVTALLTPGIVTSTPTPASQAATNGINATVRVRVVDPDSDASPATISVKVLRGGQPVKGGTAKVRITLKEYWRDCDWRVVSGDRVRWVCEDGYYNAGTVTRRIALDGTGKGSVDVTPKDVVGASELGGNPDSFLASTTYVDSRGRTIGSDADPRRFISGASEGWRIPF